MKNCKRRIEILEYQIKQLNKKNIDYLRIIEIFVLGIIGIIISFKQIEITEQQKRIAEVSVKPNFEIGTILEVEFDVKNDCYVKNGTESLLVYNNGANCYYNIQNINFLVIYYTNKKNENIQKILPLDYYYGGVHNFINNKLIYKNKGYLNNTKRWELMKKIQNENSNIYEIDIKSFIRISYENLLGDKEKIYFTSAGMKIDNDKGAKVFKLFYNTKTKLLNLGISGLNLDKLTLGKIEKLLDKKLIEDEDLKIFPN